MSNFLGYVKQISAGPYLQRTALEFKPTGGHIEKIDKTHYRVKSSGIVKEFKQEDKSVLENKNLFFKRCERLKWRIRANAYRAALFVTLTYAQEDKQPMRDTKKLYEDFRRFWQQLKRSYNDEIHDYIVAFEPQVSGSWHAHVILLSDCSKKPIIANDEDTAKKFKLKCRGPYIQDFWPHGFSSTQRCKDIDDLGEYLTSYLTKLDENDKKSSRLHFYPPRFRFGRWSRGVAAPIETKTIGEGAELSDFEQEFQNLAVKNDFTREMEIIKGDEVVMLKIRTILYVDKNILEKWKKRKKSKQNFYKNNQ